MKKLLVLIIVGIAFLVMLKYAVILLFWSLLLFIRWGSLVIILGVFLYLGLKYLKGGIK